MSHNNISIDISTLSPPPLLTVPNAPERPIHQDPIGPNLDSPIRTSAATTSGAPSLEPLIPGNRKCSDAPPLELAELNILCQSARQYNICHSVLPEPLRDPRLFHVINATTTGRYIFANGAGLDPYIYNYDRWSNALRGLDTTLAPYTHQVFSPTPFPSTTIPPPGTFPYPRHQLLIRMADDDGTDSDQENIDPDNSLQGWETYDPANNNHYPICYTDEFGREQQCRYIRYVLRNGIPTIQGCRATNSPIYGDILHPRPHPNPVHPQ